MAGGHQFDRKAQSQPKHPKGSSGTSRVAVIPTSSVGWRGPGAVKKVKKVHQQPTTSQNSNIQEQLLPLELQQLLLNIFRDTFLATREYKELKPILQEINDALIQKDFAKAFRREELLEAYAVRWSPSRALAYANLLAYICGVKAGKEQWIQKLVVPEQTTKAPAKIVCFGGGAADIVAFAGLLRHLRSDAAGRPDAKGPNEGGDISESLDTVSISDVKSASTIMDLHIIDSADWTATISKLHTSLGTPLVLSKYASTAARLANASFLASHALSVSFTKANVLQSTADELCSMIGPDPTFLTLLFTLNDLYSQSISKTTAFLLKLTAAAPKETLLLVVDTPGAYSEVTAGSVEKNDGEEGNEPMKYPMQWLMDRVLLDKGIKKEEDLEPVAKWEKIMGEESRLNKLEDGLRYPVLENFRFQVHLFKRV
jgi:25S rRNA (uracil2843-N3)-methyltransferase